MHVPICRMGAPFLNEFVSLHSRLEDAGLVPLWTQEVMDQKVKEIRESDAAKLDQDNEERFKSQVLQQDSSSMDGCKEI